MNLRRLTEPLNYSSVIFQQISLQDFAQIIALCNYFIIRIKPSRVNKDNNYYNFLIYSCLFLFIYNIMLISYLSIIYCKCVCPKKIISVYDWKIRF